MYISYPNISKYKLIRLNMYINFNDKFDRIIQETFPFTNLAKDNKSAYLIFYSFFLICSSKTRIGWVKIYPLKTYKLYFFVLHLDDYLMLWFSLRTPMLVFSQSEYSLEASITTLTTPWVRRNYGGKSEEIIRNIKRVIRKGLPSKGFKTHKEAKNKVTWNEWAQPSFPVQGPSHRHPAFPGCQVNGRSRPRLHRPPTVLLSFTLGAKWSTSRPYLDCQCNEGVVKTSYNHDNDTRHKADRKIL